MSETLEQLEARQAAELRAFYFIQDDVNTSKAAAEALVAADCPKITAAGLTIGDETIDSQYVTIKLPDPVPAHLPDPVPANWSLIRMAMKADEKLVVIDDTNGIRVRKDRANAVLNFIEANLS